ncbi:hypothetical protein FM125_11320 [Micrococcus lylae]|uniref:Yip1 domain-containing protein n=1 Tax=Micrococcus lylae TaxID=1273 RepID=A0A1R4JY89_9MICC|nr:hypothetical protein [Micrococcus lylae]SJN36959.1 hypothetical protein FM125_11320 [Micrococcus lylae]
MTSPAASAAGAPSGSTPAGPAQRNGALDAVVAYPLTFLTVLKNRPLDALRMGHAQGNGWWIQLALRNVLTALFVTVLLGRASGIGMGMVRSISGGYFSRYSDYWALSFGASLQVFLMALLLFFLIDLLRGGMLHLAFAVGKAGVPFSDSGQIVATAYSGPACITAVGILGMLLPGSGLLMFVLVVGGLLATVLGLTAELLMYIGVNRRHRFEGSPLMPFVAGFAGWILGTLLILYVFSSVLEGMS